MICLVDTHIFLWAMQDSKKLSATARKLLADPRNELRLSVVSLIEIAIKQKLGKLEVEYTDLRPTADKFRLKIVPLLPDHAEQFHEDLSTIGDPFDRMLLATAAAAPMYFLTADQQLHKTSDLIIEA